MKLGFSLSIQRNYCRMLSMSTAELEPQSPKTIQLLKPVEDYSIFIPGYADTLMNVCKEEGIVIYENEQLFVTKDERDLEGESTMWYHVFDKTNGFPQYALTSITQNNLIIGATTYDYYSCFDKDIMEVPLLTSTRIRVIPINKIREIYTSELNLTDTDLCQGVSEKVIRHETLLFDAHSRGFANEIAQQIMRIPGEDNLLSRLA